MDVTDDYEPTVTVGHLLDRARAQPWFPWSQEQFDEAVGGSRISAAAADDIAAWIAVVTRHLGEGHECPNMLVGTAVLLLARWQWESAGPRGTSTRRRTTGSDPLELSGAGRLLRPWRVHRAGAI